jgi:hypothetical protein
MYTTLFQQERRTLITDNDWPMMYRFVAATEDSFKQKLKDALFEAIDESLAGILIHQPEIELARFEALERMEDTLSRWTQRICSQSGSFTLDVNNFGGFPPHTVFARIADNSPLKKLIIQFRKLDMYLTGNGMPPLQSANRFTITLSHQINDNIFESLLYKTGRIGFHESAIVKVIHLQHLVNGQWQTIRPFYLTN